MKKILAGVILLLVVMGVILAASWSSMINMMMPADSRPGKIEFTVEKISAEEFESIAREVTASYDLEFGHIKRFKALGNGPFHESGDDGDQNHVTNLPSLPPAQFWRRYLYR